ncbi:four-carbon acid sugar kinase family protein [Saxibacter everestensis]|uniref:Four-carbon acid sugar kinase family protein n=1 Tax=Saxibacter everestensis TaxID=2909229 RepID=A0ABY8QSB3_9MICO|nr:four-carbon acid sugar kinase family protein [Brevibacteriaceae bacterium ZFBP1038]
MHEVLANLPEVLRIDDANERIRTSHQSTGRRIALLDDDPTGSQTVHGVSVVMVFDRDEYRSALAEPGSECFILTNTRGLDEPEAVDLNRRIAADLFAIGAELDAPVSLVSRSDSTLRGHVVAEMRALNSASILATGAGFDGILFAPAFFEAGRFTVDDVHYAGHGDDAQPVGETEFARDATFGYSSSNLREFIAEKSAGEIRASDVLSLSLDDIRIGGPERVAEILLTASDAQFIVVNATCYEDLEVVLLGVLEAEKSGKVFAYRAGPSIARPLAGIEAKDPLTATDIFDGGAPEGKSHGLVVVGSHVGLTSRQVKVAQDRCGLVEVDLDVNKIVDVNTREQYLAEAVAKVQKLLAENDVLVYTSRDLVRGIDEKDSLRIARTVSSAVNQVVRGALEVQPRWVIAKGGITSHEVAVEGLGIRRATVLGQLFRGLVSVLSPKAALPQSIGVPYVVFAGNVGTEQSLADAIDIFTGTKS